MQPARATLGNPFQDALQSNVLTLPFGLNVERTLLGITALWILYRLYSGGRRAVGSVRAARDARRRKKTAARRRQLERELEELD